MLRKKVFDPRIAEHDGRIVKTTGDGVPVEFASSVDAAQCAIKIQQAPGRRNEDLPEGHRIQLRIGINLGDIIADGDDISGDGVNLAGRLEGKRDSVQRRIRPPGYRPDVGIFDTLSPRRGRGVRKSLKNRD